MSSLVIKIIACATMLLDHWGYLMKSYGIGSFEVADIFRSIGRISFPLFAFLIGEGFKHTKNPVRYAFRLFLAGLISEIPYDLCFHRSYSYDGLNVMFTLLFALFALIFSDLCIKSQDKKMRWLFVVPPFAAAFVADNLGSDYGLWGVILIFLFYLIDGDSIKRKILLFPAVLIFASRYYILSYTSNASVSSWGETQILALFAFIPLLLYNGKKGHEFKSKIARKAEQYAFYLFYPAHLLLLYYVFPLLKKL